MAKRPKKAMILGLDAPIAPRLYKYAKEGKLPALAKVINNGVWAKNVMVPLPTITPPNWTSISTGAWPSTHGVTDFNVHLPNDPLDRIHWGFYSGDVKAEFVWNALERAGKRSVVVNYPTTWPPTMKNGYQIGGAGVEVNQWFWPAVLYSSAPGEEGGATFRFAQHGAMPEGLRPPRASLSFQRIFMTKPFQPTPATRLTENFTSADMRMPLKVDIKEPSGWQNAPKVQRMLEAELVFRPAGFRYKFMANPVWNMLVLDTTGAGYDRVIICDGKNAAQPMADLKVGQWSRVITREFQTEVGSKKGAFAMKLMELSKDAQDLRLFHSAICALDGWSYPESLAAEIKSVKGLPYPAPAFFDFDLGLIDTDTVLEIMEFERQWLSDACTHILINKPWDLFIMHYHPPDHAWHSISWMMDPAIAKSEAEWQKYQEMELDIYRACDRLTADLFACANEDETVFALVSDHGAKATNSGPIFVNRILEGAGLLVRGSDNRVDWSKTRAFAQRSVWVYVNLKGRDPTGIVELGKEYREVQELVIKALTEYVDPVSGKKPVLFALRKDDARFINIYGDYVGDVVFAVSEQFGAQHGVHLPTAEWGLGSLRGILALSGAGVKKGMELERNVWILDLVPTICYLAGWPMPKNAEGAILFQALTDPDLK